MSVHQPMYLTRVSDKEILDIMREHKGARFTPEMMSRALAIKRIPPGAINWDRRVSRLAERINQNIDKVLLRSIARDTKKIHRY